MPFYTENSHFPHVRYEFIVNYVLKILEELTEKIYDDEKDDHTIRHFVEWCEVNYDGTYIEDWINENYIEYIYWDDVEELFSTEEEKEPEELKYIDIKYPNKRCPCGGILTTTNCKRHFQTNKHQLWLNTNPLTVIKINDGREIFCPPSLFQQK